MKKLSKKEIHSKLKDAMNLAIEQLDIAPSTKRIKKLVSKASWKISDRFKEQIKKRIKKEEKAAKLVEKKAKVSNNKGNKGKLEFTAVN